MLKKHKQIFHEVAFAVLVNAAIDHDRGFEIKMRQILNTPTKKGLQENLGNLLQKVTKGRHNDLPDGYILKDDRITAQIKNAVPKNYYHMLRILDAMMLSGILDYNQ